MIDLSIFQYWSCANSYRVPLSIGVTDESLDKNYFRTPSRYLDTIIKLKNPHFFPITSLFLCTVSISGVWMASLLPLAPDKLMPLQPLKNLEIIY